MLKWMVMLTAVVSLRGQGLEPGPQPGESRSQEDRNQIRRNLPYPLASQGLGGGPQPGEGVQQADKKQVRRNLPYPFIPIYIPYQQVVEVHHVVMLQPPTCLPGGSQVPSYISPQPGYPAPQPGFPQPPAQQPGFPQPPAQQPGFPQPPAQQPGFPQPPVTEGPSTPGIFDRMNGKINDTIPQRPSRCVWAIVACCSPDSNAIRYSCFELLGCPGAFWGVNPCESKVVTAAANTALNYYMSGGEEPEANIV
ncbi:SR-related and CTD-associated factor 4 [Halyomorpha halys]|uniref:SR-related and CTD-associated factor 4 n=1 Tax=Halyomorpha halys TaxID=286706 RepID=UPI0006D50030|nr:splicing factor, arginine/serine-rich 15 [Halyomorpha halys]